jgi:hypothetical protein
LSISYRNSGKPALVFEILELFYVIYAIRDNMSDSAGTEFPLLVGEPQQLTEKEPVVTEIPASISLSPPDPSNKDKLATKLAEEFATYSPKFELEERAVDEFRPLKVSPH